MFQHILDLSSAWQRLCCLLCLLYPIPCRRGLSPGASSSLCTMRRSWLVSDVRASVIEPRNVLPTCACVCAPSCSSSERTTSCKCNCVDCFKEHLEQSHALYYCVPVYFACIFSARSGSPQFSCQRLRS